jgi:hypothetical protein
VPVAALVGAGAIADLDAMTVSHPEGDTYALQGLRGAELRAALKVEVPLRLLQVTPRADTSNTIDVADCATLRSFVELTSPDVGELFARQCRPGATFTIVSEGRPGLHRILLPPESAGLLRDATIISTNPASVSLPAGQRDLIALPGADRQVVQDYVSRVMSVAPQVQVTDLSQDSYAPFVQPTRRQLFMCTGIGLLAASALLTLASLDNRRRTRLDDARLVALGASRRLAARVHAVTFGYGATVTVSIGVLIGTLGALVYDHVGGLASGPGGLGLAVAGGSVLVGGAAVLMAWAVVATQTDDTVAQDLHRE